MKPKPEEIQRILSENVKNQRKKLEISQEKLAETAGVSVQTVNDVEGCRKWVSAKTITKLSNALGVECFQLLIPDFFAQIKKETSPTHNLLKLKEQMHQGVNTLIDTQFTDFIKGGGYETPEVKAPTKTSEGLIKGGKHEAPARPRQEDKAPTKSKGPRAGR